MSRKPDRELYQAPRQRLKNGIYTKKIGNENTTRENQKGSIDNVNHIPIQYQEQLFKPHQTSPQYQNTSTSETHIILKTHKYKPHAWEIKNIEITEKKKNNPIEISLVAKDVHHAWDKVEGLETLSNTDTAQCNLLKKKKDNLNNKDILVRKAENEVSFTVTLGTPRDEKKFDNSSRTTSSQFCIAGLSQIEQKAFIQNAKEDDHGLSQSDEHVENTNNDKFNTKHETNVIHSSQHNEIIGEWAMESDDDFDYSKIPIWDHSGHYIGNI